MTAVKAISDANAILPGIAAPDNAQDPRWQAIIAIADFVQTDPDPVWTFVARWGRHADADLRAAVATCLLEHLLEYHFPLVFPRVEDLVRRDPNFADTFAMCSKFGQSELPENASRFDALKAERRR